MAARQRSTEPRAWRAFVRRTLGAWILFVAIVLTATLVWMGMNDVVPDWFLGIATVL